MRFRSSMGSLRNRQVSPMLGMLGLGTPGLDDVAMVLLRALKLIIPCF